MKLTVLAPGHFHAALLQNRMVANVDPTVHVFAEDGPDLADYERKIVGYNERASDPTRWHLQKHTGADFLAQFTADPAGDVAVISGNNRYKSEFLTLAVAAGLHTLADKPMAIDAAGFRALEAAFTAAKAKGVLLYDIMTERFEITTMLQKAFSRIPAVYGAQDPGSVEDPAVTKVSVHHFSKLVSGQPIKRPAWFFDVAQQGEGLVDITTHLVDLVQWACFPGESLDYRRDIRVLRARRWPTIITPAQFMRVTQLAGFPDYLHGALGPDGNLQVYANGEIDYTLRGLHARVEVRWDFEAPPGGADTHFSIMRGTRAQLVIRQGEAQGYRPVLTIEPQAGMAAAEFEAALRAALPTVQASWPGIDLERRDGGWEVTVPAPYHNGHEAHFGQVAEHFLDCIQRGALPDWEVPNMLAKYYTTTTALALAHSAE